MKTMKRSFLATLAVMLFIAAFFSTTDVSLASGKNKVKAPNTTSKIVVKKLVKNSQGGWDFCIEGWVYIETNEDSCGCSQCQRNFYYCGTTNTTIACNDIPGAPGCRCINSTGEDCPECPWFTAQNSEGKSVLLKAKMERIAGTDRYKLVRIFDVKETTNTK